MMLKQLFLFTFIFHSTACLSKWAIGLENYSRHIGKIQTDSSGSSNFLEFNPGINFSTLLEYSEMGQINLIPSATIFFPESTQDNLLNKYSAELNLHASYPLFPQLLLLFGASYQLSLLSGSGGTITLNNGNSTASYFVPSSSQLSHYLVPEIGISLKPNESITIGTQLIIHQILDSQKRTFSLSFNFSYWFENDA